MKALTLHQPWASAIAAGLKHYETRPRRLKYRGPIAIHAGKKYVNQDILSGIRSNLPFSHKHHWPAVFPYGMVVAMADMTDCLEMDEELIASMSPLELLLGDWQPGRFAYKLENVRALDQPVEVSGAQGLWNLDESIITA